MTVYTWTTIDWRVVNVLMRQSVGIQSEQLVTLSSKDRFPSSQVFLATVSFMSVTNERESPRWLYLSRVWASSFPLIFFFRAPPNNFGQQHISPPRSLCTKVRLVDGVYLLLISDSATSLFSLGVFFLVLSFFFHLPIYIFYYKKNFKFLRVDIRQWRAGGVAPINWEMK